MNEKIVVMGIALFLWTMGRGKGIPSLYRTLKGFTEAGHEVHLLLPFKEHEPAYELDDGIHIHRFKRPLKNIPQIRILGVLIQKISWLLFLLCATIKAYKIARTIKPDVVYGFTSYGAPVAWIIGKIHRVPNITRLFGVQSLYPFLSQPIRLLSYLDLALPFKLKSSALIITNDGTQGDKVAEKLKVPPERLKFWMNGIDKSTLNISGNEEVEKLRQSLKIDQNSKIILTVSRLVSVKRVDRLIRAIPAIVQGNKDVVFVIVGEGNQQLYLENLSRQLSVAEHTRFTGAVLHESIPYYLNMADIFVSLYDESNLGNPLLEAMISGKCIVTLNTGATGQIINHNYNGILLDSADLDKLPETIKALLKDNELRTTLGKNARNYALEHFQTWDERVRMEVELVQDLCKISKESR
ncbi:glycosyltransferase family 4 protein [Chloroflexota bacterium]